MCLFPCLKKSFCFENVGTWLPHQRNKTHVWYTHTHSKWDDPPPCKHETCCRSYSKVMKVFGLSKGLRFSDWLLARDQTGSFFKYRRRETQNPQIPVGFLSGKPDFHKFTSSLKIVFMENHPLKQRAFWKEKGKVLRQHPGRTRYAT